MIFFRLSLFPPPRLPRPPPSAALPDSANARFFTFVSALSLLLPALLLLRPILSQVLIFRICLSNGVLISHSNAEAFYLSDMNRRRKGRDKSRLSYLYRKFLTLKSFAFIVICYCRGIPAILKFSHNRAIISEKTFVNETNVILLAE